MTLSISDKKGIVRDAIYNTAVTGDPPEVIAGSEEIRRLILQNEENIINAATRLEEDLEGSARGMAGQIINKTFRKRELRAARVQRAFTGKSKRR